MWCRYCFGKSETGKAINIDDLHSKRLQNNAQEARNHPETFLRMEDIFGDLGKNRVFKEEFASSLNSLWANGVEKTLVSNVDSLLNGDGGVVHIGITEKKPTGLFNDLKLFPKKKRTQEEFEKKLRETLQNRLSDSHIGRTIRVTFPKTHSVTICEIFVQRSSVPIFVITKNKDEEFYVRENGKLVRLSPRKAHEYIQEHFFDVD